MKKLIDKLIIFASILSLPEILFWYFKPFKKMLMNTTIQQFLVCATFFTMVVFIIWIWTKIESMLEQSKTIKKEIERRDRTKEDIKNKIIQIEIEKENNPITLGNMTKQRRNYDDEIRQLKNKLLQ